MSPSDQNKGLAFRKGAWTIQEDTLLKNCIETYGEGKWHLVPLRSGLRRCRKSCRLRWLNYLRPNLKKGDFGEDEIDLICRLHKLLGNRWSLIAGRIPGRTGNDVKNYWNTHMRSCSKQKEEKKQKDDNKSSKSVTATVIKPQPYTFSKIVNLNQQIELHDENNSIRMSNDAAFNNNAFNIPTGSIVAPTMTHDETNEYLETLYGGREDEIDRNNFGWSFDGCIMDGNKSTDMIQQEEDQVNLFNFPEEAMWDLLDSE